MKFIEIQRNKYMSEDGSMMFEGTTLEVNNRGSRIYSPMLVNGYTYSSLSLVQLLDRFASEVIHLPQANAANCVG